LKYHYFKTLRTDPPIVMSPAPIGNGDPIPFIAIDNNVRRDIRFSMPASAAGVARRLPASKLVSGVRFTLAAATPHKIAAGLRAFMVVDLVHECVAPVGMPIHPPRYLKRLFIVLWNMQLKLLLNLVRPR
jgi:hypothetical protein